MSMEIKMRRSIHEPGREVIVRAQVDVLVCGGGVAGTVAALAARREGASVLLVEPCAFLGGAATAAQVTGVGGWQYDLDGWPLIAGLPLEVMRRATAGDAAMEAHVRRLATSVPKPDYRAGGLGCFWVRTNPERTKRVLDMLMDQVGIDVLLHATAVAPVMEGSRVCGAFIESKSGREAVLADVVIDCTGDGDIAARAGAPFDVGRPGDGACQPMTLICTAGRANVPSLWYGAPDQDPETDPLRRNRFAGAIAQARARGEMVLNPNDVFCAATALDADDPQTRAVNFTRIQGCSATDAAALTQAAFQGRCQAEEALRFMRAYMPGCEHSYLIATAPNLGIRESRRIRGEYVLSEADVRGAADFPDVVCRGIYLLDIHNPSDARPSVLTLLDAPYSIPYRALLPVGVEGLLTAGRCISGDHVALASYRVQSHAMALGAAAGTAAALAAREGIPPRLLDVEHLHARLLAAGANLGPRFR